MGSQGGPLGAPGCVSRSCCGVAGATHHGDVRLHRVLRAAVRLGADAALVSGAIWWCLRQVQFTLDAKCLRFCASPKEHWCCKLRCSVL